MNRKFFLIACAAAASLLAQPAAPPKTHLKVGDAAPDFELNSTAGGKVKLSSFRGQKNVVVAFFPAAFTGGCTKEMAAYTANLDKFAGADSEVFGVSTDNTPSLREFGKSLSLKHALLSDFMRKTSADYGVLMPAAGVANRTTFVVDKEGKITFIEEGSAAVDINSAMDACSRLKK